MMFMLYALTYTTEVSQILNYWRLNFMGFAAAHNHGARFSINTEGFEFRKITEFPLETEMTVRGALISKGGKYGDSASIILDDCFMNIPKHMVDDVKDLVSNPEAIEQVEAGLLACSIYEYKDTNDKTQRSIRWIDK